MEAALAPLFALTSSEPLDRLLAVLADAAEALCGEQVWSGPDGRALGGFIEELREAAERGGNLARSA